MGFVKNNKWVKGSKTVGMIKIGVELTNLERDMFDIIIKKDNINAIHKYVIGNENFCINFYNGKYKQIVQSKDYDKNYLIKEVRKNKLKKLNI